MFHTSFAPLSRILAGALALLLLASGASFAQTNGQNGNGETLIPGIWVDPDGCEHWVMDDGFEGYMSPVLMNDGRPVCGRNPNALPICGLLSTDTFFATDKAIISAAAESHLRRFFRSGKARVFNIEGHTDSRASNAYNQDLSERRAAAVAAIARDVGVQIQAVTGYGETRPRASNATRNGMAINRRVEIICVR